jgi:hypothetical protein
MATGSATEADTGQSGTDGAHGPHDGSAAADGPAPDPRTPTAPTHTAPTHTAPTHTAPTHTAPTGGDS